MIEDARAALGSVPTLVDISRSSEREPKRWAVMIYDEVTVYYVSYFWTKSKAMDAAIEALADVTKVKNP